MVYADLRAFVEDLEEQGDLIKIGRRISPRLEAAAVMRALEEEDGPAVFFNRLTGHKPPTVGNLLSSPRRLERVFGTDKDVRSSIIERWGKGIKPRKARAVPVHQVIKRKGIDLPSLLPVFTYYERDAAPYMTSGVLIAREPLSQAVNLGIYRLRIRNPVSLSIQIASPRLAGMVADAEAQGEALPVAIALGVDPGLFLGSVCQTETGLDKLELTGGLRNDPLEVVRGVTVDLPVPARAELILEGRILPGKRVAEGPQGDSPGVYTRSRNHLIEILAVTRRERYWYHALLPWSRDEDALRTIGYEIPMQMRLHGHDSAVRVFHLMPGTCGTHAVISMKKRDAKHARDLIELSFGLFPELKHVVVVDDDVDPTDQRMVSWALSVRFQASRDLMTFSGKQNRGDSLQDRIGMDATMSKGSRRSLARVEVGEEARVKALRSIKTQDRPRPNPDKRRRKKNGS